jgi:DNA-binding transcriptional MerR regulator
MTTAELLKNIDIPLSKLYYLEQKGYIKPRKRLVGEKEFRIYSEEDVLKIRLIWKHLKNGFRYRIAYERAVSELIRRNGS